MDKAMWLAVALMVGSAGSAAAQDSSEEVREVDFDDADLVEGGINGPWLDRLSGIRQGRRTILLRPRTSFRPELMKSVENL